MDLVPYLLFLLAGLGFGYAAFGAWKWLPIALPVVLALVTALQDGVDGTLLLRFAIALVLTAAGILVGAMLDRAERPARAHPGWR
jgi:hypothetical protein